MRHSCQSGPIADVANAAPDWLSDTDISLSQTTIRDGESTSNVSDGPTRTSEDRSPDLRLTDAKVYAAGSRSLRPQDCDSRPYLILSSMRRQG